MHRETYVPPSAKVCEPYVMDSPVLPKLCIKTFCRTVIVWQ